MSKIIEIEELGFPKSLIIRDGALVSELIDTKDLVNELNEQLSQYNVVGQSEQLVKFSRFIQKYKNEGLDFDCVEREVDAYLSNCH